MEYRSFPEDQIRQRLMVFMRCGQVCQFGGVAEDYDHRMRDSIPLESLPERASDAILFDLLSISPRLPN